MNTTCEDCGGTGMTPDRFGDYGPCPTCENGDRPVCGDVPCLHVPAHVSLAEDVRVNTQDYATRRTHPTTPPTDGRRP